MSELRIVESSGDVTLVALAGRLDLVGTEEVSLRFTAETVTRRRSAIVDLREVTFLASLGMRMFVSAARALQKYGARIVLLSPQPRVRDALEVAGLLDLLPIATSETEARQLVAGVA